MWFNKRGSSSAHGKRRSQLGRVLADVIRWRSLGEHIDDAAIASQHRDPQPETGERLEVLRTIQAAQREAEQHTEGADSPLSSFNAALDEDLGFLRSAMIDYKILDRIRYGGQGVVYRAYHQKTKRTVAIKLLLDGPLATARQLSRFEREAELTSRLQHPNIVTLYDYGVVRGRPYFAMQYVDGLPISDYVVLHDLPPRETVALFVTLCVAVSYAHQNGIIHRDLNPSNILVDASGQPHVLDFGLAKDFWAGKDSGTCSTTGQVVGTLPYLSPEQAEGADGGVDVRSDIYSLGVVLFELLTDVMPYPVDGGPQRIRDAILSADPLPLRKAAASGDRDRLPGSDSINHDLEMILHKVLAKNKAERYQSAAAFANDLERYLAGDAVEAKIGHGLYLLRKALRKYRLLAAVAALILCILAVSSAAVIASLMQARNQRDNARAIARVAHATLDNVVSEIEESVRPLAGGLAVRDRLLEDVAGNLARLEPLVESDATMADLLVELREKQGDVAYAQGRHAQANEHYQTVLEVTLPLAPGEASSVKYLALAARVYRKAAAVSDNAEWHYGRAIDIGEALLQGRPDAWDIRHELCRARIDFGLHLFGVGRFEQEREQVDAILALVADGELTSPHEKERCELLATAYAMRGNVDVKLGQHDSALRALTAAMELRQRQVEQRPADVGVRHKLFLSCGSLGCFCRDEGRIEEAARLFRRAVEVGEYLTTVDPAAALWKRDLYGAYDRLVRLLIARGDFSAAQRYCKAAFHLAESLSDSGPDSSDWQRIRGFAHKLRGRTYAARGEWQLAHDSLDEARQIRERLVAAKPENLELKAELADTYNWLGKCCRKLDQPDQALAYYEEAYSIRKALLAVQPPVTERVVGIILSQTKLATWHLDRNTPADDQEAAGLLAEAEESLVTLHEAGRLIAGAGKYSDWLSAIRANQSLIDQRAEARALAERPSGVEVPGASASPKP